MNLKYLIVNVRERHHFKDLMKSYCFQQDDNCKKIIVILKFSIVLYKQFLS